MFSIHSSYPIIFTILLGVFTSNGSVFVRKKISRDMLGYDTRSIEADLPDDLQNLTLDLLGYGNASYVRFYCVNS